MANFSSKGMVEDYRSQEQVFDLGAGNTEATRSLPSVSEVAFFILFTACIYLALYSLMVTTTNTGISGLLGYLFLVANWCIMGGFILYFGKLVMSAIRFVVNDV